MTTIDPRIKKWLSLSRDELDQIYKNAEPGTIPSGDTRGTAIVTGSLLAKSYAAFARLFSWQGKVFDLFAADCDKGLLINKITPFSLSFIVAKVYRDKSWMDGKDTIVIDYSTTSFFAKKSETKSEKSNQVFIWVKSGLVKSVSSILR